ncbi:phosphatidylinositol 3-kinase regulatory subunit alpha-like [Mizuhopecten yessoensis]|uniref:phosphatidylinositol 3-kinase regulatory subunit alpha-like n=1 Tax=Mizuhopecten yessoensis TaxID=6573 RepID=UPI000B45B324|nr:phosphatidylinositol 3-kinase regulatory subunit alpha-like [Mizuhopecten yessoensis]XP_021350182.1 phosphatidylinositol 3-kinase regulatory subunit alpha-like [Mizuhopecten yessoensis]
MDGEVHLYTAMFGHAPEKTGNEDEEPDYISIDIGDILEVKGPRPTTNDTWMKGHNKNKGTTGFFPGNFVEYVGPAPKVEPPALPEVPRVPHRLVDCFFLRPVICFYCKDYIWGTGKVGRRCDGCKKCCHLQCWEVYSNTHCRRDKNGTVPQTLDADVPLKDWNVNDVVDWMAALNIYRYAQLFRDRNIDGTMLEDMDEEKLKELGIKDNFHKKSIMVAIDELCGREPEPSNGPVYPSDPMEAASCGASSEHRFAEYSFSSMQRCHLCDKFLYGLVRQGLQCRECGMCSHRYCSSSRTSECNVPKIDRLRRPSFTQNSSFGAELGEEVSKCHLEAPWIIVKCTEVIEKWCVDHKSEALSVYRIFAKTEEINEIKAELNLVNDPTQVNLAPFNVHCVAGALKKYLRELPNPVIPVDMYDAVMAVAQQREHGSSDITKSLVELITALPGPHQSTLRFLMAHFIRLWKIQHESEVDDGLDKLSHVFCHILLRPPWEKIIEIVDNTKYHIDIFEELLKNGSWGEAPPPSPPTRPPRPQSPIISSEHLSVMSAEERLKEAEWYWGNLSREEVNELLRDKPDGTFLVRDSATQGDYTLTIRKGGTNKLIKIYHSSEGKFGFVEPLTFNSVVDLIQHYSNISLSIYNRTLDTKLLYPVSKNKAAELDTDSLKEECKKLQRINAEYLTKMHEYDTHYEEHSKLSQELQLKHQALDAFKETVAVFEEQMELHRKHQRDVSLHDIQKLHENYELLKSRCQSIHESKEKLETEINRKTTLNRTLISDMNSLRPEIKRLHKQREQVKKFLLDQGEQPDSIDAILLENDRDPLLHEKNWFVNCVREQAERLLAGTKDGTFLIRPKDHVHVLSIMCNGKVGHCIIGNNEGRFGFSEGFYKFDDVKDLVLHYHRESLKEHNGELDTKLIYPVHCQTTGAQGQAPSDIYLKMRPTTS